VWFGFGAAVKLLPGVALVWCALRRSWRTALVGTVASPRSRCSFRPLRWARASIDSLSEWWSHTAQPYERGGNELL